MDSSWKLIVGAGLAASALSSLMPWLTISFGFGINQSLNLIDFLGGQTTLEPIISGLHLNAYPAGPIALMALSPILLVFAILLGGLSLFVRRTTAFLLVASGSLCVLTPLLGIVAIQALKQTVLTYGEQPAYAGMIQIDYGIYVAVLGALIVWIGYLRSHMPTSGRTIATSMGLVLLILVSPFLVSHIPVPSMFQRTELALESYQFPIRDPVAYLYATFRNSGTTTFRMQYADYFFNRELVTGAGCRRTLDPASSCTVTITIGGALTRQLASGGTYPLRVAVPITEITSTQPFGKLFNFTYQVTYGTS